MTRWSSIESLTLPREEEIVNAASHGLGLVAAVAATPILIVSAADGGGAAQIVGACVFAVTAILLYMISTLYHALPSSRTKAVFQLLDHGAIYLLIAGTYTPFTLGVLHGAAGWAMFGCVWGLAILGVVHKSVHGLRYPRLSTWTYLGMGWICIVFVEPILTRVPVWGLVWLLAGGVAYSAGVWFYAADTRIRYAHLVWHLLVMLGTGCHFVAVLEYSA